MYSLYQVEIVELDVLLPFSRGSSPLSFFYRQLAQLLEAVGSLKESLRILEGQTGNRRLTAALRDLRGRVATGLPLADALALDAAIFPADQVRLVRAGEAGGRLPEALRRISERLDRSARLRTEFLGSIGYPILLLHGVFLVLPIGVLIRSGFGPYLLRASLYAGSFYAIAVLLLVLARRGLSDRLPFVRSVARDFGAARSCWTLGALYEAGTGIREAISEVFPVGSTIDRLDRGSTVAEALESSGRYPGDTIRILHLAETTGNLGEALLAEADRLEERASTRLAWGVKTASRVLYFAVVITAAASILSFYAGYYSQLGL